MTIVNSLAGTTSHPDLVCNQRASNMEVSKSAATSAFKLRSLCVSPTVGTERAQVKTVCRRRARGVKLDLGLLKP